MMQMLSNGFRTISEIPIGAGDGLIRGTRDLSRQLCPTRGVKEVLLSDTKDFLKSEQWYADRGISFRRVIFCTVSQAPGRIRSSMQ